MILIASGAYLQGEFVSEVGLLPPSFLPIGNKRLFEYQIDFLRKSQPGEDVYISLPATYKIDLFDEQYLTKLGVEIIRVPQGLSLGDSILFCWNASGKQYQTLTILHGDTLFLNALYTTNNSLSIHKNIGFYQRATLGKNCEALEKVHDDYTNNSEHVISGYFHFCSPLLFMRSLVESRGDFIKSIVNYHKAQPFQLIKHGDWLDFGHINSFFDSRTKMTTQRAFNDLKITKRMVSKRSKSNPRKIYAEGSWFANIPLKLKLYTPSLLGLDKGNNDYQSSNYQLEYLYLLPLSDLYVFGRLSPDLWDTIFKEIALMLKNFAYHRPKKNDVEEFSEYNDLYLPKTLKRLHEYAKQSQYDLNTPYYIDGMNQATLIDVAEKSAKFISSIEQKDIAVTHGDLCFSNILFDSRAGVLKCIDPRGVSPSGKCTIYGDHRYDLAKLYHSVIGLYDFIIAGRFNYQNTSQTIDLEIQKYVPGFSKIRNSFNEFVIKQSGYSEKEILAITIHLFLSMLPLHSDRPARQKAFIANTIRLFKILKEINK